MTKPEVTPLFVRLPSADIVRIDRAVASSGKTKRQIVSEAVREHLAAEGDDVTVGRVAFRPAPREVLSAAEAAELLQLDEAAVAAAAEAGDLPGRKIAGEWRFSRAAILAWLAGG